MHNANTPEFYVLEHHPENGSLLGFWIYLMSDCLIFACLFATYAVIGQNYAGGPNGASLFELHIIAVNTAILLVSSITYGMAMLAMQKQQLHKTMAWLAITGLLGIGFISLEVLEFMHLVENNAGPDRSGFLTAFFALVGAHGLHVAFGIVWIVTMLFKLTAHGFTAGNQRGLLCLSMFWHFLDVVWIGVFTFVYLMGVLA
jgi:cytochrome o ubiquinol oxidase subunit 3